MNKTQKGFALVESLLILVVVAIIGGTGYYVWHVKTEANKSLDTSVGTDQANGQAAANSNLQYTNSKDVVLDAFNDCAKTQNMGATLDDSGKTLSCKNKQGFPYSEPALEVVKTISASLSRPGFAQLPQPIRQTILGYSAQDCSFNNITVDSPSDSAVKAMQAGDFIWIAIGCDGAGTYTYQLVDGTWRKFGFPVDKDWCTTIADEKYPIELLLNTFDPNITNPIAKCLDSDKIEHQVVVQ